MNLFWKSVGAMMHICKHNSMTKVKDIKTRVHNVEHLEMNILGPKVIIERHKIASEIKNKHIPRIVQKINYNFNRYQTFHIYI